MFDDYLKFCEMGFTIDDLKKIQLDAVKNAFLSEEEKTVLMNKLKENDQ
jgi:adenosine deaminase